VHLLRRFFGFLTAKPLSPADQQHVAGLLHPRLARAFFAQRPEDQRHALDVQARVHASRECTQAALLHDIGKTGSGLGAVARSLATLCRGIGLPTSGRWRSYLDHGVLGADMLVELEADDLAVAFTRFHPGSPPSNVERAVWQQLENADNA
jgi:hypothetical protein